MAREGHDAPELVALTRREFLALSAAATGAAGLAAPLLGADKEGERGGGTAAGRFTLPDEPNQNPAFMARAAGDGGLLLWRESSSTGFRGYRVNRAGRQLWRMCDGSRDLAVIGAEFASRTGRPAATGVAFVERLMELGIIVSGVTVVPASEFPTPPPGGCYHRRVEPDDPVCP